MWWKLRKVNKFQPLFIQKSISVGGKKCYLVALIINILINDFIFHIQPLFECQKKIPCCAHLNYYFLLPTVLTLMNIFWHSSSGGYITLSCQHIYSFYDIIFHPLLPHKILPSTHSGKVFTRIDFLILILFN